MVRKSDKRVRVAVIGASGYTGADFIRLALRHPGIEIVSLIAKSHAGKAMDDVFPHLAGLGLPALVSEEDADWSGVDTVVCGLPHGTAHQIIARLPQRVKVVDMSADFRLRDTRTYAEWYGLEHGAPELLAEAVYGLTEHYAEAIARTRLVACPGCYPTATLLALLPLVANRLVDAEDLVIDAKSGVSGAGRALKQNTLFSEAGEGMSPYSVAKHRHAPEIEQEIGRAWGAPVTVNFTPHLVPMSRGELCTCYVRLVGKTGADDLRAALVAAYRDKPFIRVLAAGKMPATQNVRGSNYVEIAVFADRIKGRAIVISALDNLVKGSAGQAMQNFNLMHGWPEATAVEQLPLFP
ncbi:MAG: N-acetyl-gamma-glutamyl-phosphate reductase [Hyphomicrobiaceae bacterium]